MTLGADVEWTYDPENLGEDSAAGRLAEARLHLGDTDVRRKLIGDAELNYFITNEGNNAKLGAAAAAEVLANRFDGMGTRRIGDITIDYSRIASGLRTVSASIKNGAYTDLAAPWMASHKVTRKENNEQNDGLVQPYFSVNMHENPGSNYGDRDSLLS